MKHLLFSQVAAGYVKSGPEDFHRDISDRLRELKIKIVVLDDDPTGIQTVHGCLLLTNLKEENLLTAFRDQAPLFYILTNSRAKGAEEAAELNRKAVSEIIRINGSFQYRLIFISRSDSTLRGHFPLEPETILQTLALNNQPCSLPVFFVPAFFEAGRFTLGNVQYMKAGDELIPAGETEFAKDSVFGYCSSSLPEYITEKSKGEIRPEETGTISLEELRNGTLADVAGILRSLTGKRYVVANALDYSDLWKLSLAFLDIFSGGKPTALFRTSSSFPKAISGLDDRALLTENDWNRKPGPGLFIAGSHVQNTTRQLQNLLRNEHVTGLETDVRGILDQPERTLQITLDRIKKAAGLGKTPVVYTPREEIRLEDVSRRLELGLKISGFLVQIIRNLPFQPAYIVAKGGITSHDILTQGLEIESARVLGQVLPGVPVVMTGKSAAYPEIPYVIFPGNVGHENSLSELFRIMTKD